jgi:phosphatidate cytidylyltransferase
MKDIYIRSLTGAVIVFIIVGSILLNKFAFAAVFFIITLLGTHEFYKMLQVSKYHPQTNFGTLISTTLYTVLVLIAHSIISPLYLTLIVVLLFIIPIRELYRTDNDSPIPNISQTIFGILYVGLTFGLMNFLFYHGYKGYESYHFILAFFVILWTSDSFAYITGVSFGKHKLFERISPKKSWEGFFGGLIAALIVGYTFSLFFNDFGTISWIGYAAVINIGGVYGDLIQSLFKRSLGLKDSGSILPGHGGILDRFDAAFVAIPVAIAYVVLIS